MTCCEMERVVVGWRADCFRDEKVVLRDLVYEVLASCLIGCGWLSTY